MIEVNLEDIGKVGSGKKGRKSSCKEEMSRGMNVEEAFGRGRSVFQVTSLRKFMRILIEA